MTKTNKDIFERMLTGGVIQNSDPEFYKVFEQVTATKKTFSCS